ncbi:unnamed protein product [Arctogadus glacialis]
MLLPRVHLSAPAPSPPVLLCFIHGVQGNWVMVMSCSPARSPDTGPSPGGPSHSPLTLPPSLSLPHSPSLTLTLPPSLSLPLPSLSHTLPSTSHPSPLSPSLSPLSPLPSLTLILLAVHRGSLMDSRFGVWSSAVYHQQGERERGRRGEGLISDIVQLARRFTPRPEGENETLR